MKKTLLMFCATLLPILQATAAIIVTIDGINYSLENGEAAISTQNSSLWGDIVIPETVTYDGVSYTVTSAKSSAFNTSEITSIKLPNTITSLGDRCFAFCSELTDITLPENLTILEERCFENCLSLASIDLPDGITSLGDRCFSDCLSLTSIDLPAKLTSMGNYCFYYCYKLTSIDLPDGITSLGNHCFYDCLSLASIDLPNSLTKVGNFCFRDCSSLSKVICRWTDLTGLTIGHYVFDDIDDEATLYVPKGTKSTYEATNPWRDFKYIIELDEETAIDTISLSDVEISSNGSGVSISGLTDGVSVQIYDISGRLLSSGRASVGNVNLSTAGTTGVVVIKIGEKSVKVAL